MSPEPAESASAELGFPRVSGDEPLAITGLMVVNQFSPRERG